MVREHHYSCDDSVELPRSIQALSPAGGPRWPKLDSHAPLGAHLGGCVMLLWVEFKDDNHRQQKYDVKFLLRMNVVVVIAVAM